MIHKPETVVDLDTGAITSAQVLPGDHPDARDASTRILEAQQFINQARGEELDVLTVETAAADKGYFEVAEIKALQAEGIKTVISDPVAKRRLDKLEPEDLAAVKAARRSVWPRILFGAFLCPSGLVRKAGTKAVSPRVFGKFTFPSLGALFWFTVYWPV